MIPRTQNRQGNVLKDTTSRSFKGGLNVADSQLNLSSKFATILDNLVVGIDGSITVRQGTKLFADLASISDSHLIGMEYFAASIITINSVGQVFAVDGRGNAIRIWDQDQAQLMTPPRSIWAPCEFVTFEEFNGQLIIGNGQDKPLVVTSGLNVDYLADVSGSNINVPVGKVMAKSQNHLCIADGSTLHVSERNASGTWQGDIGTIFTGVFDMKTYVTRGSTEIIGLIDFKNTLLVQFRECIVPVRFVETAATTDDPAVLTLSIPEPGPITNYGTITPKSLQNIGDIVMGCDIVGVQNIGLATFTKELSPDRPSRLVDPLLQRHIATLSTEALYNDTFSVFDRRLGVYMLMFPDNVSEHQSKSVGFGYRYIENLDIKAWHTYSGWNWHCGTRSSEGNVFFARNQDTAIFVMGDELNNPLYADFIGEQETFSDGTTFTDQTGFGPVSDIDTSGVPIKFTWELPWADMKQRGLVKTLRYIIMDTEGKGAFDLLVFVDDLYRHSDAGEEFDDGTMFDDDSGFTREFPLLSPALQATLVGKDEDGYGEDHYGDLYGGGNTTLSRRLTYFPTKFNTIKLRFEGEISEPLKFVAITPLYQVGSIRRMSDV